MTGPRPTSLRYAGQLNAPIPDDPIPRCCSGCRRGVVPGQFPCGKTGCACHQPGGANHVLRQRPAPTHDVTDGEIVNDVLAWMREFM